MGNSYFLTGKGFDYLFGHVRTLFHQKGTPIFHESFIFFQTENLLMIKINLDNGDMQKGVRRGYDNSARCIFLAYRVSYARSRYG